MGSAGGIQVENVEITEYGPLYDRSFFLVDESNSLGSQKVWPELALVSCSLSNQGITLTALGTCSY